MKQQNPEVKLSVVFITYNHEKYIRRSLDGIMAQKVNFPFEVVVGEDCSTDHTRDILREYKRRYPGVFRLLFRKKNLGRPTLNVYLTAMKARGEYLAFLEGDDYWTDPGKLQRQVDFLDNHPRYMGTTHSFALVGEEDEPITNERISSLYDWEGEYTFDDWKAGGAWPGQTASNVCRNFFHNGRMDYTILYRAHDFIDDGIIFTFLLLQGPIYRFGEVMAAHRYVEKAGGESWNSRKLERNYLIEECLLKRTMMEWCELNVGLTEFGRNKARRDFRSALGIFLKHPDRAGFEMIRRLFSYYVLHLELGRPLKRAHGRKRGGSGRTQAEGQRGTGKCL